MTDRPKSAGDYFVEVLLEGPDTTSGRGQRERCHVKPVMSLPAAFRPAGRFGESTAVLRACRPTIRARRATRGTTWFRGPWEWVTRCREHDTKIVSVTWAEALGEVVEHQLTHVMVSSINSRTSW